MIAALAVAVCVSAAPPPAELSYDLRIDVPVTAAFGAWWLLSEFAFKHELAPSRCGWCGRNSLDDAARGVRGTLEGQRVAARVSDVLGVAAVPVTMLGLDVVLTWGGGGTWRDGAIDALLIIEAMVSSQALNQAVKFLVGRERPFVAALPEREKPLTTQPEDNNLSFFSGHTSYTFALVAATATIARARGYRLWWVALAAGVPMAAGTALLRMIADKHYLSDVFTGALLGALIGWGVPALFHRPVKLGPATAWVSPGLGGLSMQGVW